MSHTSHETIVLITGASSGIGEACAHVFAKAKAKLILLARREERLRQLQQTLTQQYQAESMILAIDITDETAILTAIQQLPPSWHTIDVLINNAGLAMGLDKVQDAALRDWHTMIDTNIRGLMTITHALVPGMIARQRGHIVNMGSIAGQQAYQGGSGYCATKAAVHAFNACLKLDLTGTPVRVSEIAAGLVETEFSQIRFQGDTTRANAVYQGMQALGAEDIADLIYFCVTRPAHVNILTMLVMPTAQSSASVVHRNTL
jgi:3-hydroxy acid dehydrogenase/malonic semialdehyde reductase